jgi:hypothetical protein
MNIKTDEFCYQEKLQPEKELNLILFMPDLVGYKAIPFT